MIIILQIVAQLTYPFLWPWHHFDVDKAARGKNVHSLQARYICKQASDWSARYHIDQLGAALHIIATYPRFVIPRLENLDKTPKLNPRINLWIHSDLIIIIPRFILSSESWA